VLLGHGHLLWQVATSALMTWGVKTRSGFEVESVPPGTGTAELGIDYRLTAALGPFKLHEPVRVVAVVDEPARCGFAYGTLEGHPVSGEEAFVVHRDAEGAVWLTLRSLTRPGHGRWRLAFPVVLVAQRWYRWRYLGSLRDIGG
jgi:uncharacterized protein (UPF0548 family)